MARNIVSQDGSKQGSIFPESFIQGVGGNYEPDPTYVVRQYGWGGDPWLTRATMIHIRLNQGSTADCPAYFLSLTDTGDMYLTKATAHVVTPAGTKHVTGVTRHSSIDRIALRLKETASHAT